MCVYFWGKLRFTHNLHHITLTPIQQPHNSRRSICSWWSGCVWSGASALQLHSSILVRLSGQCFAQRSHLPNNSNNNGPGQPNTDIVQSIGADSRHLHTTTTNHKHIAQPRAQQQHSDSTHSLYADARSGGRVAVPLLHSADVRGTPNQNYGTFSTSHLYSCTVCGPVCRVCVRVRICVCLCMLDLQCT